MDMNEHVAQVNQLRPTEAPFHAAGNKELQQQQAAGNVGKFFLVCWGFFRCRLEAFWIGAWT